MGFHTFSVDPADTLEDPSRYRFCSREELAKMLDLETLRESFPALVRPSPSMGEY